MMRKPFYGNVPLFPGAQDMSWIPDGGTNVATSFPAEAPTGYVTTAGVTFTFTSVPKYIVYNGDWLRPTNDFDLSGTTVTMPQSVEVGAEIYAVV